MNRWPSLAYVAVVIVSALLAAAQPEPVPEAQVAQWAEATAWLWRP